MELKKRWILVFETISNSKVYGLNFGELCFAMFQCTCILQFPRIAAWVSTLIQKYFKLELSLIYCFFFFFYLFARRSCSSLFFLLCGGKDKIVIFAFFSYGVAYLECFDLVHFSNKPDLLLFFLHIQENII